MRSMIVWGITCWNVLCALDVHIETPHAIVMNAETGAILYEKRAHASVYPASTTKIATVLYALQQGREGEVAEASREALRVVTESIKTEKGDLLPPYILETDGTTAHLRPGQKKTLVELMDDAIDLSANDSANVLAEYLEGDILVFTWRLNEMAKALGCKQTHFVNPHGLFHPDHTTTAYDMAMIMKAALHYPLFRTLIKEAVIVRKYPFAVGGKTGYTRRAKYNIVAVAKKGEREIIAAQHASPHIRAAVQRLHCVI